MNYKDFGLCNTNEMLHLALRDGYAVPAFNFNNMEQLQSIMHAAHKTKSPVILQVSESGLNYIGQDILMAMIGAVVKNANAPVALNLDHGRTFEICKHAIDIGFSSVMIDASDLSFSENIELSKRVADYAHQFDISTEAELGIISGKEDGVSVKKNQFTNPAESKIFIDSTGIDSLAVSVGTLHGAYKTKAGFESLRFDILDELAALLCDFPLVLHGSSSVPENLVKDINKYGGDIKDANGIPADQLRRAAKTNVCKINIDSDGRLAFTAGVRESLFKNPNNIDPRKYLSAAMTKMTELYVYEIENICGSNSL